MALPDTNTEEDKFSDEDAKLKNSTGVPPVTNPTEEGVDKVGSNEGFERFLQLHRGSRRGKLNKAENRYASGQYKGMTRGEADAIAFKQWQQMPEDEKSPSPAKDTSGMTLKEQGWGRTLDPKAGREDMPEFAKGMSRANFRQQTPADIERKRQLEIQAERDKMAIAKEFGITKEPEPQKTVPNESDFEVTPPVTNPSQNNLEGFDMPNDSVVEDKESSSIASNTTINTPMSGATPPPVQDPNKNKSKESSLRDNSFTRESYAEVERRKREELTANGAFGKAAQQRQANRQVV